MEKRLELIEFILTKQENLKKEENLGTETIKRLWGIFVQNSNFEFERRLFFRWLNKDKNDSYSHWRMFTNKEKNFIFNDILCNPVYIDPKTITQEQLKTFEKFFSFINQENGALLISSSGTYNVKDHQMLKGLPALWDIVLQASETNV